VTYREAHAPGSSYGPTPTASIEILIEDAVERAVGRLLAPHLRRLSSIEPVVYTVVQASEALQVSEDTISRLVRRGVLPRVPHIDGKVLIPRRAVDALVAGDQLPSTESTAAGANKRSIRSAAS
jgi:excisionase family DNA binding protein